MVNLLLRAIQYLTRYACSKGNKTDGVDTILEVNEAAEMASNVADYGSD